MSKKNAMKNTAITVEKRFISSALGIINLH
jgi:hypothetical protein